MHTTSSPAGIYPFFCISLKKYILATLCKTFNKFCMIKILFLHIIKCALFDIIIQAACAHSQPVAVMVDIHHRPSPPLERARNGCAVFIPSSYRSVTVRHHFYSPGRSFEHVQNSCRAHPGANGRQSPLNVFNGRETALTVFSPCAAVRTKFGTRWRTVIAHGHV
jgi:hypothetical protein